MTLPIFHPLRSKHYGALLVDPPWAFKTHSEKHGTTPHRGAHDHYKVMSFEQLCALPVADLAAKDCALFMWVVDSHLDEALKLGAAWGYTYKTRAFTWRKLTSKGNPKIGMGYWTRKQTEMCWLFTRGAPKRLGKGVRELMEVEEPEVDEIIDAPRREHSRKPDEQYERIEALVGGPYAELFARTTRPGWDSWGNETKKFSPAGLALSDDIEALL